MHYYTIEGNIHFPNNDTLTWGPYYYYSKEKAIKRMPLILNDITNWADSMNNISKPEKIIHAGTDQLIFKIWISSVECSGMIEIETFEFEDEKEI